MSLNRARHTAGEVDMGEMGGELSMCGGITTPLKCYKQTQGPIFHNCIERLSFEKEGSLNGSRNNAVIDFLTVFQYQSSG